MTRGERTSGTASRVGVALLLLAFLAGGGGSAARASESSSAHASFVRGVQLYEAGKGGYYTYRIPSLVASQQGTLLAFYAARKNRGGDWDPIDILMRRSTDAGKSWALPQVVVHQDTQPCDNATPIVDYQTGAVHLLYQIDYALRLR